MEFPILGIIFKEFHRADLFHVKKGVSFSSDYKKGRQ
jgi:hypothetical protein